MYRPLAILLLNVLLLPSSVMAAPKVVVISLDGGTPRIISDLLDRGVLPANRGIGQLRSTGFFADRSVVAAPSLTAVNHITIATGSTSAKTDIASNTFHLLASPFTSNVSGFGAPIGGYEIDGPAEAANPTAFPIWHSLRAAGKTVVTATWPGGDGVDVRAPGLPSPSPIIQSSAARTVDVTVPFGEFGGVGGQGFTLTAADPLPTNPSDPRFGRTAAKNLGQDFGDVFAMLTTGYNFDGAQSPVVQRLGDPPAEAPVFQVPNFYGAHGYDPQLRSMGAIFFAAGPDVVRGRRQTMENIDIAPTIAALTKNFRRHQ